MTTWGEPKSLSLQAPTEAIKYKYTVVLLGLFLYVLFLGEEYLLEKNVQHLYLNKS